MTTRIALISDLHGNAPALRAALAAIDAAAPIDHICCLGDAVSIGPDINEVLDLLRARPNLFMVMGNHETYVLACRNGDPLPPVVGEGERVHQRWMADRITAEHAAWLATLPFQIDAEYEGVRVSFMHYPQTGPGSFVPWRPELDKLEEHFAGAPADVVCMGHFHEMGVERGAARIYANPRSLGCCNRPVARYAILTLDAGQAHVELCEAPYENRAFLASYDTLEVPEREFIRRIFHGNQAW